MQWNIERGGVDRDGSTRRWPLIVDAAKRLATEVAPDLVFINEAYEWVSSGRADLFAEAIGATGWRRVRHPGGYDMMLFASAAVTITGWVERPHWMAPTVTVGLATVRLPGWPQVMAAITHLSPWSGQERWQQAARLASLTNRRGPVLLAGDFNCIGPDDAEPDMGALPPDKLFAHKLPDSSYDNPVTDRRALAELADIGWHDAAALIDEQHDDPDGPWMVEVPTSGLWGTDDMPCRKAHVLLNPDLDRVAEVVDYQVHGADSGSLEQEISDHLPISATLRLRAGLNDRR